MIKSLLFANQVLVAQLLNLILKEPVARSHLLSFIIKKKNLIWLSPMKTCSYRSHQVSRIACSTIGVRVISWIWRPSRGIDSYKTTIIIWITKRMKEIEWHLWLASQCLSWQIRYHCPTRSACTTFNKRRRFKAKRRIVSPSWWLSHMKTNRLRPPKWAHFLDHLWEKVRQKTRRQIVSCNTLP